MQQLLTPSKWRAGRSKVVHSAGRVFRCMDTSSTIQMAQIMVKHGRSSGSSWTKYVLTSTRWSLVGKITWKSSIGTWMGKKTELGMSVCSSKTRIILIGTRGSHQNGWKETEHGTHVEDIDETRRSWRTKIISWPTHLTWMQTERNRCYQCRGMCESRISATEKFPAWRNVAQKRLRGLTIWKDLPKSLLIGIVNGKRKDGADV